MPFDQILALEAQLKQKFEFTNEEISFVTKHKPTFLLWDQNKSTGMTALQQFFVEKHGLDIEYVRTLVVKYPFILSKTQEHLDSVLKTLEE